MDLVQIGGVLRAERKKLGKSLEQIADELGIGISTVSSIERGIYNVSEDKRTAYAKALGMGSLLGIANEAESRIRYLRHKLRLIEDIVVANPENALVQLVALNQAEKIDYMGILRPFVYYLKAKCYFGEQNWDLARKYFHFGIESMAKYPELDATNLESACYNELSTIEHIQGNDREALKQVRLGVAHFTAKGERTHIKSLLLLNQCIYLTELGLYEKSLQALDELNTYVKITDQHKVQILLVIKMYAIYTRTFDNLGMQQKALKYAKYGEEIAITNKKFDSLFTIWCRIGDIYLKLEELELAREYFFKALELKPKVKEQNLIPYALKNFITLLMMENDWEFAKEIIDQCIAISKKQPDERNLAESLVSLAKWYKNQERHQAAIDLYHEAEEMAEKHPTKTLYLEIIADLCYCYKQVDHIENYQSYVEKFYWLSQRRALKMDYPKA